MFIVLFTPNVFLNISVVNSLTYFGIASLS